MKMKKSLIYLVLLISLFFLISIKVNAAISFTKSTIVKTGEIMDGVTFESFKGTTINDNGTSGLQNISYVKKEASSGVKVVAWSKLSGSTIVGANIIALATDFEAKNPGYKVIAGINGDYYNMTTKEPVNALVQNSDVVRYYNFSQPRYFSIGINDSGTDFITSKNNELESNYVLSIYDNTNKIVKEVKIVGFNTIPSVNQTTVIYKNLQEFEVTDAEHFFIDQLNVNTNYGSILLKGKVSSEVTKAVISNTQATIITKDSEVSALLKTFPNVRVQKNLKGANNGYDNIIGVGSQPLKNNLVQSFEDIGDQNVAFASARAPRSSIGFTEDGSIIIATMDGRQTNMDGVNLREEAFIMKSLGCSDAFNFDGGGSTQLMIRENNTFKLLNSATEPNRANSNGILFVVPDVSIDANFSDLTSSTVDVDYNLKLADGVTLNSLSVYVNEEKSEVTGTSFTLENLEEYGINYISFEANYEKNGINYIRSFVSKRINIENTQVINVPTKVKPSNFTVTFEEKEDSNGFDAIVNFDDPNNTIVKLHLINNGEKEILMKSSRGYFSEYKNITETTSYSFTIEYHYILNTINPVSEVYNQVFDYTYEVLEEPNNEEPIKDTSSCSFLNSISIFYTIIPVLVLLIYRRFGVRK